jgi:hypothetical protein
MSRLPDGLIPLLLGMPPFSLLEHLGAEPAEAKLLLDYLAEQRRRLAAGELDAVQLAGDENDATVHERAAWTLVARALMNLDEAIVKR